MSVENKQQEPKQYHIDTFKKLCEVVNEENYEAISTDLVMWLGVLVRMKSAGLKGSNWTFVWIDDGKHDLTGVTLKNSKTGEQKYFEFKKATQS